MTAFTDALIPLLREEEGLRLTVYDDANGKPIVPGTKVIGHPTVGIGRALDTNGITSAEADYLLGNDIAKVTAQLDKALPWWSSMSLNRRLVLAGMVFQLGLAGTLGFKNTLAMMQRGDYAGAARGMLASLWAKQTPARVGRMAAMMENG